jgi:hypothetical protein
MRQRLASSDFLRTTGLRKSLISKEISAFTVSFRTESTITPSRNRPPRASRTPGCAWRSRGVRPCGVKVAWRFAKKHKAARAAAGPRREKRPGVCAAQACLLPLLSLVLYPSDSRGAAVLQLPERPISHPEKSAHFPPTCLARSRKCAPSASTRPETNAVLSRPFRLTAKNSTGTAGSTSVCTVTS